MKTEDEGRFTGATFSSCKFFRYRLWRRWDSSRAGVLFIMLNPSTADAYKNDPTVERCQRRAVSMGFGSVEVCNLFAFRSTDPKAMRAAKDPVGPSNDVHILEVARNANMVIAGWGTHGGYRDRDRTVRENLRANHIELHHLGLTKAGHPRHPLYIGYDVRPMFWGDQ